MNLYGLSSVARVNSQRNSSTGQRLNALAYGPIMGENTRATNYGPSGNRLTSRDVALSPGLLGRYPLGSRVDAKDAAGNLIGLGTYTVGDKSYRFGESQPTRNTIEFRDANRSGQQVYISPSGFRPIPRSGNVYGDYGADVSGEPQVLTSQNIPPNEDVSPGLTTNFYLNQQEFGGGPNAPTYGSAGMGAPPPLAAFDPMGYGANPPPNEDVSPGLVSTFLSNYNPNAGSPRRTGFGGGYPDLSGLPPVSVSAPYGTASNPYPIPGYGGLPSTYGGGQSWQSNASRGGGFAGLANSIAAGGGFGGGLASRGGGFQQISELPSGLGGMSWAQAFGGGGARVLQN